MKPTAILLLLLPAALTACSGPTPDSLRIRTTSLSPTPHPALTRAAPPALDEPTYLAILPTPSLFITPQLTPVTPLAPDALIVPVDIPWSDLASNSGLTFTSFTIADAIVATPPYCTDECVTSVWRTQDMTFTVTLAIARASSPDRVPEVIKGYYSALVELAPEYRTGPEFRLVQAPFANTTFAFSSNRAVEWLTTSVDDVAVLVGVRYRPPPSTLYDFDDYGIVLMLAELANRQIAKLQAVGAVR